MTGATIPAAPPTELAARAAWLRRLELDVRHRIEGRLSGDTVALGRGPGSDRVGARFYEPGDDARRIDWNLTARATRPHVHVTEPDRELETWFVADCSASLDFGTTRREKRELVSAAMATFGFLAAGSGGRIGVLVCGGDRVRRFPARPGRTAVLAALGALADQPRAASAPAPGADLGGALEQLARQRPRRGRVVVASDFLETASWQRPLGLLASRHDVVAVHVLDRRELELPEVGLLRVVDAETGRLLEVETRSPRLRARYAQAAEVRTDRIRSDVERSGARYLSLRTDRDWAADAVAFLRTARRLRAVPSTANRRPS